MRFVVALLLIFFCVNCLSQQLVLPGAHPDPSTVKIGDTYWASATSSNWFPAFPLFHSKDLLKWQQSGYVFLEKPSWADYYFWAPEISYDSGKVYIYYTAHKKGGSLCVGVATADRPDGPYTDLGPLVCQPDGSIDAFAIRDTSNQLYLVWKEDGNSAGRPTPIWAQPMNNQRTALEGERIELFRNNAPWEKELVEGVSMIRHGDYFYAFYAAAGCCGDRCTYESGVARAKALTGPWEKYNNNPVLTDTGNWICKGHGTPIEKDGKFYFLYHGYDKITSAFTGREALLQEFVFTEDDWIKFINITTDSIKRNEVIKDDFNDSKLGEGWQWSVFDNATFTTAKGKLQLHAEPGHAGSFVAQKVVSSDYTATAEVMGDESSAMAGIGAIGDDKNIVALLYKKGFLQIMKVQDGKDSVLYSYNITSQHQVYLQMRVKQPYRINFLYSFDGKTYILLNQKPIRGVYLPPWDSPPRVGLLSKGNKNEVAVFEKFSLTAGAIIPTKSTSEIVLEIAALVLLVCLLAWFILRLRKRKKQIA